MGVSGDVPDRDTVEQRARVVLSSLQQQDRMSGSCEVGSKDTSLAQRQHVRRTLLDVRQRTTAWSRADHDVVVDIEPLGWCGARKRSQEGASRKETHDGQLIIYSALSVNVNGDQDRVGNSFLVVYKTTEHPSYTSSLISGSIVHASIRIRPDRLSPLLQHFAAALHVLLSSIASC